MSNPYNTSRYNEIDGDKLIAYGKTISIGFGQKYDAEAWKKYASTAQHWIVHAFAEIVQLRMPRCGQEISRRLWTDPATGRRETVVERCEGPSICMECITNVRPGYVDQLIDRLKAD